MISVFHRVENIVGKGENAGYQHFLLFPQCFQTTCFSGSLKVGTAWLRVKGLSMRGLETVNHFERLAFGCKRLKIFTRSNHTDFRNCKPLQICI